MGMMESLRAGTESPTVRVVLFVVVLFFVFWGVGSGSNNSSQVLAEVGSARITDTMYQREMRDITRSLREPLTEEATKMLSTQVLDYLIGQEAMLQEAARLGIEVSDEEIARAQLNEKAFQDSDGRFSEELYQSALKRTGMTESRYEEQLRRAMTIFKLQQTVSQLVHISDAEVEREYRARTTQVDVQYVRVPEAALLDLVPVDEAAIDARLAADEAKIKAQYEADKERVWSQPRKAQVAGILLRGDIAGTTPEALRARADQIRAEALKTDAAGFAALATTWSEDLTAASGGNLGLMSEPQMDPQMARGVFATAAGQISEVVQTGRGLWVLRVESSQEAVVTSYDDAKRSIARALVAQEGVSKFAQEYAEKILAGWKAAGAPPADLLDPQELRTRNTGPMPPASFEVAELGPSPGLSAAVRAVTAPGPIDGVFPAEGGWVVAAVTSYTAPDMAAFETQREGIRLRLTVQQQQEVVQLWQKDLESRVQVTRHWTP